MKSTINSPSRKSSSSQEKCAGLHESQHPMVLVPPEDKSSPDTCSLSQREESDINETLEKKSLPSSKSNSKIPFGELEPEFVVNIEEPTGNFINSNLKSQDLLKTTNNTSSCHSNEIPISVEHGEVEEQEGKNSVHIEDETKNLTK